MTFKSAKSIRRHRHKPPKEANENEDFFTQNIISVPDTRVGSCLGPEGNGVSSGQGGEGGPGPPQTRSEISSQLPARKEATWSRRKKERRVRRDEEDPSVHRVSILREPLSMYSNVLYRQLCLN
jgi:hypothetical protein